MGYIGGGILFLLNVIMYLKTRFFFGKPDGATAIRLSFVTVAVWWAVFSIPVAIWVRNQRFMKVLGLFRSQFRLKQLRHTFKEIRHLKVVGTFLLAYWFYIDGVDTIVKMAVDYGVTLKFPDSALITALLMVQFIAFPCALLFNLLSKKIGVKQSVMTGIIGYGIITFLAYFMSQMWHLYTLAALVGLFQGESRPSAAACIHV
ncbi:MAG: hypothetical protein Ct9H300mP28_34080 [Pseudomonadota bacterium]|nr:MAG: hypothetical protein Ct9H300mP28_34080 [Pseudomonadota bacterium]